MFEGNTNENVHFGHHGNSAASDLDNDIGTAPTCTANEASEYHFITVDESSGKVPRSTLTTVRAHVRRHVQHKSEYRPNFNLVIAPASKGFGTEKSVSQNLSQKHRFKLGPQGLKETKKRKRKDKAITEGNIKTTHSLNHESTYPLQPIRAISIVTQNNLVDGQQMQHWMAENSPGIEVAATFNSLLERRGFEAIPLNAGWGVLDPFNSLPEIPRGRAESLLFYANQIVSPSRILGKLRHAWLECCVHDEAMLHITLAHFAGDHSVEQNQIDEVDIIRLKTGAMSIVNDRLNLVKTAVEEGTIGTVACIASYQSYYAESVEQLRTANIHMNGLRKLLEVKGGSLKDGIGPIIVRQLLWADLTHANAMGTDLIFPLSEYTDLRFSNEAWAQLPMFLAESDLRNSPSDLQLLGPEIDSLVSNLRKLLRFTPNLESENCNKPSTIQQSDELLINQATLMYLARNNLSNKLVQICVSTVMIILDNYTRGVHFNTYVMARNLRRIHMAISGEMEDGAGLEIDSQTRRVILWSLFVGRVAAAAKPSALWFASQITCLCASLGLEGWNEIRHVLKSFLWPITWDDVGMALWQKH